MKKIIIKILIIIGLIGSIFIVNVNALDLPGNISAIKKVTIDKTGDQNIVTAANDIGFYILRITKIILQGLLVIYIVYIGGKMIMSMGSDEGELTKAKSQIWYSLIAVVFINIPGVLYEAITFESGSRNISKPGGFNDENTSNIFLNIKLFSSETGIISKIIDSIEVFIFIIAIYVMIMAGIKIMNARGREDKVKEAKEKLLYSFFAMIFVGFIEAWKQVAISGKLTSATYIFSKGVDLALLFAGPVAIAFLTFAGYIYITANGEEEKTKKAKNIIINTLIAMVLLIVMVTFLNDLTNLV